MNIYQYTAINNPNGAREVVESYGIRANKKLLPKQLAFVVAKNGEEALDKVAMIHPDLSLFQRQIDSFKDKVKKEHEEKSNFLNADGQQIKDEIKSLKDSVSSKKEDNGKSKYELLIIGGIIVLGLAVILRNK
jgi:septal ring factor EnvC (AmiA/AmiB activator)